MIRGGIEDKDNFSNFSTKTYVVTPHWNCLEETVPMMGHKYVLWRNVANYSSTITVTLSYLQACPS